MNVSNQAPLKVKFRNHIVGEFSADIVVEDCVIVELKAVSTLKPEHEAQIINYLKATGIRVALLVNTPIKLTPQSPLNPTKGDLLVQFLSILAPLWGGKGGCI